MSKPTRPQYKATNWPAYNRALRKRGSLTVWFDKDMRWLAPLTGKNGRNPTFSDAAIQFCLTIKGVFGLPLRQTIGMVESLIQLSGLDWPVPDFSTLSRRQKTIEVSIPYRPQTGALHLLIDSTGIKFRGEGEWKRKKHGAEYRRQWRKVHLGIDAETLEIRAIEVTDNSAGDAPMLPELLRQIPQTEVIATVSIRKNGKAWKEKTAGDKARNEILAATRYLGRPLWKTWSGYHRRSLVETKMRCFKLLGERVMARDPHRQVVELQVRAAILNNYTRLGVPHTLRVS